MQQRDVLNLLLSTPPTNDVSKADEDFYNILLKLAQSTITFNDLSFEQQLLEHLAFRWLAIKASDASYCQYRRGWLNQLCLAIALLLEPQHPYLILMPDLKGKKDIYHTSFDELGLDDFITTDNDTFFIVIKDFFETAWQRICQNEPTALHYINQKNQLVALNDRDIKAIAQLLPISSPFFALVPENIACNDQTKGLVLLEMLRQGLLNGDVSSATGSELNAGSPANIAIVNFKNSYDQLTPEYCNKLRRLKANYQNLGYFLDLLFRPFDTEVGVRHCIQTIGRKIEEIINKNVAELRKDFSEEFSQLVNFYEQVVVDINNPILLAIVDDDITRFKYHFKAASIDTFIDDTKNTYLHKCATHNSRNIAKFLLDHNANTLLENRSKSTPLFIAIEKGNLAVAECFLGSNIKVNVNQFFTDKVTLLYLAAKTGSLPIIELLLASKGIRSNDISYDGQTPLHIAVINDHLAIVQRLLQHSRIQINKADKNGDTPLHIAVKIGNLAMVNCLLTKKDIDIDQENEKKHTPLHIAAEKDYQPIAELLLSHSSDVNRIDFIGRTPLRIAVEMGNEAVAYYLLTRPNININQTDKKGQTLLHIAVEKGHQFITKFLLLVGSDVNQIDGNGWTPLCTATAMCNPVMVSYLLTIPGIDINRADNKGQTPLHIAAEKGYQPIAELLLLNGSNVNLINGDGWTPLGIAVAMGNPAIVSYLLTSPNININQVGKKGQTLLNIAIAMGHQGIVELLLLHGSDVNQTDGDGWTPLRVAIAIENRVMVSYLLTKPGIDVDRADKKGRTPLHIAAEKDLQPIAELLLLHGSDVNQTDGRGWTPLHIAVGMGNLAMVSYLLTRPNINIDQFDNEGQTPLHIAESMGHQPIAEHLLLHGSNVNQTNGRGWTPLHIAVVMGNLAMVSYLLTRLNININQIDNEGQTPLYIAVVMGNLAMVSYLLTRPNININQVDNEGKTPLRIAVAMDNRAIVIHLLTSLNININQVDNEGNTPLHTAVEKNDLAMVSLLLTNPNINIHQVNNKGKAPIDIAIDASIVSCLLSPNYLARKNDLKKVVPSVETNHFGPGFFSTGSGANNIRQQNQSCYRTHDSIDDDSVSQGSHKRQRR